MRSSATIPTIPHWGYNGSARRYWDFIFAAQGQTAGTPTPSLWLGPERHSLAGEYREHPDDFYLLRVGYGGTMGALTDIDQEGFASAAFHGFPDMLRHDPITGDYGPNFFGHAWNTATYIVDHPGFRLGGIRRQYHDQGRYGASHASRFDRSRVYVASLGLWLTLEAGTFESVEVNSRSGAVRVGLSGASQFTPEARLRVEQPAKVTGVGTYRPATALKSERGAYVLPLKKGTTWIELTGKP